MMLPPFTTIYSPEFQTPAALVDVERLGANLHRLACYSREHGLAWRPHVKTHKTPEIAGQFR